MLYKLLGYLIPNSYGDSLVPNPAIIDTSGFKYNVGLTLYAVNVVP